MKIKILYEDKNMLVIDKPAGISVHGDGKEATRDVETIADWVLKNYPKAENVGESMYIDRPDGEKEELKRPGIVHRLDKETSGVLLIALNQKTYLDLKSQFENHTIKKVYHTFVYGYVRDVTVSLGSGAKGIITAPIGRSPKDIRMWTAGRGAKEPLREAITQYKILNKFVDDEEYAKDNNHQFTYLEVYPKTGRTHQIRVHMRYINHPVVSDPLYRGEKEKALCMERLALHAHSIEFKLSNGTEMKIESPLPKDFKQVIDKYGLN